MAHAGMALAEGIGTLIGNTINAGISVKRNAQWKARIQELGDAIEVQLMNLQQLNNDASFGNTAGIKAVVAHVMIVSEYKETVEAAVDGYDLYYALRKLYVKLQNEIAELKFEAEIEIIAKLALIGEKQSLSAD